MFKFIYLFIYLFIVVQHFPMSLKTFHLGSKLIKTQAVLKEDSHEISHSEASEVPRNRADALGSSLPKDCWETVRDQQNCLRKLLSKLLSCLQAVPVLGPALGDAAGLFSFLLLYVISHLDSFR